MPITLASLFRLLISVVWNLSENKIYYFSFSYNYIIFIIICVCECVQNKILKRNVKMAIALVHLRRILLMCCILFLTSDLISELARSVKTRNYLLITVKRNFKIQFWTHVYIIYAYTIFMMNGFRWDQVNIFEIIFPTSWRRVRRKL